MPIKTIAMIISIKVMPLDFFMSMYLLKHNLEY
ncbi:hypothetical protein AT1219_130023 [Vibrio alginolyticus]